MDEKLFDSLEDEDSSAGEEAEEEHHDKQPKSNKQIQYDISKSVPLYSGETPKTDITNLDNTRSVGNYFAKYRKKSPRHISRSPKKKSYLSLYYAKMTYPVFSKQPEVTDTNRAVCNTSPRNSIAEEKSPSLIDSESESDFYEKFLQLEITKQISSDPQIKRNNQKSPLPKIYIKKYPIEKNTNDNLKPTVKKLELWRKRQSYGQKVSMENKIRMVEANELRKINSKKTTSLETLT